MVADVRYSALISMPSAIFHHLLVRAGENKDCKIAALLINSFAGKSGLQKLAECKNASKIYI
jgi:hypothetical protein